jgi:GNAT superfamily N-acetyltransferase
MGNEIDYRLTRELPAEDIVALYRANGWSSAEKPRELLAALADSHSVVTAWSGGHVIGIGNAISDGHLVVYYPHLLVHPTFQGRGVGTELMRQLMNKYSGFHQQMLVADGRAIDFYRRCGFQRAGSTEPMWIYAGTDH